jgi:hypothetical protein
MIETFRISRQPNPLWLAYVYTQFRMLCSVLDDQRKPLGYIDVAALKARWEAGGADPVSLPPSASSFHVPVLD